MGYPMKSYKAVAIGRRNRAAGEHWEKIISDSCRYYSERGEAEIMKTPEPLRPIRKTSDGKFIAVFTKKAQPDYKGTLYGGKSIVFEAKHTDTDRIKRSVITPEQEKQLDKHMELGAECYVLMSFGLQKFYKMPWEKFRDMDLYYSHKYVKAEYLKEYEVKFIGGILRFLFQ